MSSNTNATALKRIAKELEMLKLPYECSAEPYNGDLFNWRGIIAGPQGSPYEGGKFEISIIFPKDYPMKPPEVIFATQIYHPNIESHGLVCLDLLDKHWLPEYDLSMVIFAICSLLFYPNPHDPLEPKIGLLYIEDFEKYNETARSWTDAYAKGKPPTDKPAET